MYWMDNFVRIHLTGWVGNILCVAVDKMSHDGAVLI